MWLETAWKSYEGQLSAAQFEVSLATTGKSQVLNQDSDPSLVFCIETSSFATASLTLARGLVA